MQAATDRRAVTAQEVQAAIAGNSRRYGHHSPHPKPLTERDVAELVQFADKRAAAATGGPRPALNQASIKRALAELVKSGTVETFSGAYTADHIGIRVNGAVTTNFYVLAEDGVRGRAEGVRKEREATRAELRKAAGLEVLATHAGEVEAAYLARCAAAGLDPTAEPDKLDPAGETDTA